MSEYYHAKVRALEAEQKGDLQDIVAEKGYGTEEGVKPPMAVSPPDRVTEAVENSASEDTTRIRPPGPTRPAREVETNNVFRNPPEGAAVMDSWNYKEELQKRNPDIPYVIHYDERTEFEDYEEMTLTLYEKDNVLCNEQDEIIADEELDKLVGEDNLDRFGHGSNDPNVVYIRNDSLELVLEVVRSPHAYAEEVHGFEHTGYSGNLERMRKREKDESDNDRSEHKR
jgi:hypothetical protein